MSPRILFLLLLTILLQRCETDLSSTVRRYPCFRMKSQPVIDGIIDNDPAWDTIPAETGFVTPFIETFKMNYPPSQQTTFKAGYDSSSIYFAVKCEEPWVRYLKQRKNDIFEKDDGIEIFLQPAGAARYHHFIVNATGVKWRESVADIELTADSGWAAKTRIGSDFINIEVEIPFKTLSSTPEAGDVWKGNICRNIITINCPENRKTSWAPVKSEFDEPDNFGDFVFKGIFLTDAEANEQETALKKTTDDIFSHKEKALAEFELQEMKLENRYTERVKTKGRGITGVTQGVADLISPPDAPAGEVWRYGLGFPLQISASEAALLCNIRMEGSGNIDYEIGTDVILFNDLDDIRSEKAIAVSRYEKGVDLKSGPYIIRKGPVLGGFVPLGARLTGGSPHPHAGTGFGMCWAIRHETGDDGRFNYLDIAERYAMMFQFAYDGDVFRVLKKERVDAAKLLPDWKLAGNFVTNAIPDGKDLLYVMIARVDKIAVAGYTRWRYGPDGWHPVSFTPVTGFEKTWSEPSLIREKDGGLLFSARSYDRADPIVAFDIAVWRSLDNGKTWNQVIYDKNRRSRSPISVNRAIDGTPFIAANTPPLRRTREVLCIWPIDDSRTKLECRMTARDAPSEFGPAPSGSWWRIDHPTSAIIRLGDSKWHNVLCYRIADNGEIEGSAEPPPQTGCYVEEVFSAGKASPIWNFDY